MNDDVKYYLVLQNNPYYAGDNGDITSPSSYAIGYDTTDSGNQQRAAPGASYLSVDDPSNAESARFLTAAVAGSTGGAYACWMAVPEDETTGDPGASTPPLYIWPISVTQAAGQRPVVTAPNVDSTLKFTLTGAPTQGTTCPRDLCAVAIGTAIYFFICYWNDPDLYYFAFDGENVSEVVPCDAFAGRMGGPVTELWSIDATAVYGQYVDQNSDSSPEAIALAACITSNGRTPALTTTFLQPPLTDPAEPLESTSPPPELGAVSIGLPAPDADADWISQLLDPGNGIEVIGTSVRIGWGSPWGTDQDLYQVANGVFINHVTRASQGRDMEFGGNAAYLTCVPIASGDTTSQWQQIADGSDLLDGYFFMGAFATGAFVANVDHAMAYSVFLGGIGFPGNDPDSRGMFWIQWPSFRLTPCPMQDGVTIYDSGWSAAQFKLAIPTWTLIGVVAGVPPVLEGSKLHATLSIGLGEKSAAESSMTLDTVYGVSGKAALGGLSIGGGFSYDQSSTIDLQQTISVDLTENFAYVEGSFETPQNTSQLGYLIYLVPSYQNQQFSIVCYDNVTDVPGQNVLNVFTASARNELNTYPFYLTNMITPVDVSLTNEPQDLLGVLSQFPDAGKSWADANDVVGWATLASPDSQTFFTTLTGTSTPQQPSNPIMEDQFNVAKGINKTDGGAIDDTTKRVLTSKNQLNVDGSLNLSIFNFGGSYSHSTSTSVTTKDESFLNVTFGIVDQGDATGDWPTYEIGAVIVFAEEDNLWWVPSISSHQRPWLVTWNISSVRQDSRNLVPAS